MADESSLVELRVQIDELDEELHTLINRRARLAQRVAEVKQGKIAPAQFYRPEREAEVLRKVQARNQGPLNNEEIARLFREIMSACLALEEILQVAYLGPEGTFTQTAALKHFGHSVNARSLSTISEVFRDVESGAAHYGVVPVENSTEGMVNHTLDMFMLSPLKICGEVELRIHHHLLSLTPKLNEVECVYSHQQSLAQCRGWLDQHLNGATRISVSSNAEAARLAGITPKAAAIAGESAAEIYSLPFLARRIEDDPNNTTRFIIIGEQDAQPSGQDKTSLLVSTGNKIGTLHRLLAPLVKHEISMTRIESRPSRRGMWDYVFFIDIAGHRLDERLTRALADLAQEALSLKVLGSYPCAVL